MRQQRSLRDGFAYTLGKALAKLTLAITAITIILILFLIIALTT